MLIGKENLQQWRTTMFFSMKERIPEISHLIYLDDEVPEREEMEKREIVYNEYRDKISEDPPTEPKPVKASASLADMETYLASVKIYKHMKEKYDSLKNASIKGIAHLHASISPSAIERIKLSKDYKDIIKSSDVAAFWALIQSSFEDTGGAKARNTAQAIRDLFIKHQSADEGIQEYVSKWKQYRQIAITYGMKQQDGKVEAMIFILSLNSDYDLLKNHARNLTTPVNSVEDAYTIAVEWMIPRSEASIEVGAVANTEKQGINKKKSRKAVPQLCHHCGKQGHYKRDCKIYLKSKSGIEKNKTNSSKASASTAAIVLDNDSNTSSDEEGC